jgi:hypothetical protein
VPTLADRGCHVVSATVPHGTKRKTNKYWDYSQVRIYQPTIKEYFILEDPNRRKSTRCNTAIRNITSMD